MKILFFSPALLLLSAFTGQINREYVQDGLCKVELTSPDLPCLSAKWEPSLKVFPLHIPFLLISPESAERNAVNIKNSQIACLRELVGFLMRFSDWELKGGRSLTVVTDISSSRSRIFLAVGQPLARDQTIFHSDCNEREDRGEEKHKGCFQLYPTASYCSCGHPKSLI